MIGRFAALFRQATMFKKDLRLRTSPVWLLSIIAIVLIGVSLLRDLSGQSGADQFVLARWSVEGLRVYLWLEGGVMAALVAAFGAHVVSTGFSVTRGGQSRLFGVPFPPHSTVPRGFGYVFVVLGSALVALSFATIVLLNSCRYMRLI